MTDEQVMAILENQLAIMGALFAAHIYKGTVADGQVVDDLRVRMLETAQFIAAMKQNR